ncbi:MAG: hypothetical protein OEV51_01760, partial [Nitrospira sp.]|nr:hypothetical protein [Nitrospira sp.]
APPEDDAPGTSEFPAESLYRSIQKQNSSCKRELIRRSLEIIEHKLYSLLALAIAVCETFRRIGRLRNPVWAAPLVFLVLIGSILLFVHSHGNHPATARIEFHHALLGSVGVCAALSKAVASWMPGASQQLVKWAEVAWAGSVILFGFLLLVYSE